MADRPLAAKCKLKAETEDIMLAAHKYSVFTSNHHEANIIRLDTNRKSRFCAECIEKFDHVIAGSSILASKH